LHSAPAEKEGLYMPKPQDKTILVVDDEDDVRDYFADILSDAGFNVRTAADGEEALQCVREKVPDFISLDLVMPRKSGIKFLYELRHNREWMNVPVVVVTAHAHDKLGKKDLENILEDKSFSGPKFYLEKPIDEAAYVRTICENLGVDYEEPEQADDSETQRKELEGLIKDADPATISDLLKRLKRRS
jgi:CheY-like chemotaxis protein